MKVRTPAIQKYSEESDKCGLSQWTYQILLTSTGEATAGQGSKAGKVLPRGNTPVHQIRIPREDRVYQILLAHQIVRHFLHT